MNTLSMLPPDGPARIFKNLYRGPTTTDWLSEYFTVQMFQGTPGHSPVVSALEYADIYDTAWRTLADPGFYGEIHERVVRSLGRRTRGHPDQLVMASLARSSSTVINAILQDQSRVLDTLASVAAAVAVGKYITDGHTAETVPTVQSWISAFVLTHTFKLASTSDSGDSTGISSEHVPIDKLWPALMGSLTHQIRRITEGGWLLYTPTINTGSVWSTPALAHRQFLAARLSGNQDPTLVRLAESLREATTRGDLDGQASLGEAMALFTTARQRSLNAGFRLIHQTCPTDELSYPGIPLLRV